MKKLLYVLLFLISFQVKGQLSPKQEQSIDSLKKCISSATHDTLKINAYNAWDNIIYVSDPKLDLELNQKIVDLANQNLEKESLSNPEKRVFKKSLSLALNSIGIIFYNKGDNDKALNYYSRSLKIREEIGDKKGIAATLNNFGIIYQDQGDYAKAIEYYTMSLLKNEQIGDKNGEANTLSNIGRIYREQHDTAKAIEFQKRCLKIKESIGDKRGMAIAYSNIGSIYADEGNNVKAMEYFNPGLEISEQIGDKNNIALALANIGFVYEKMEDNTKALDYLNRSLMMFEAIGNKKWMAELLTKIGILYKKKGEIEKAIENYKKALAIAQGAGLVSTTKDASQNLSISYKITGNYQEALKMHELYIMMRDSILSEKSQKEIMKQEIKYHYDKQKALDAKEYEKQIAVSAEREQKQKVVTSAIAGFLVLVMLFAALLYNRYRIKQKASIEIQQKNKEINESISYAKRIQTSFLTSENYISRRLSDYFILYKPRDIVSGDFYWIMEKDSYLYVCTADCTGHGIPGAFMSLIGMGILNEISYSKTHITHTDEFLNELRRIIILAVNPEGATIEGKDGMDTVLCRFDLRKMELEYSAANNSFFIIREGKLLTFRPDKMPVGKHIGEEKPFTRKIIPLEKGDCIYTFSDGYVDQFGGPKGKKFKSKQLKELILNNYLKPMRIQNEILNKTIEQWKGICDQVDDILVIGIRI